MGLEYIVLIVAAVRIVEHLVMYLLKRCHPNKKREIENVEKEVHDVFEMIDKSDE